MLTILKLCRAMHETFQRRRLHYMLCTFLIRLKLCIVKVLTQIQTLNQSFLQIAMHMHTCNHEWSDHTGT